MSEEWAEIALKRKDKLNREVLRGSNHPSWQADQKINQDWAGAKNLIRNYPKGGNKISEAK